MASGHNPYKGLLATIKDPDVSQEYKEKADIEMRQKILANFPDDPWRWYGRMLESLSFDVPYDPSLFASQIEFVVEKLWRYETAFGKSHDIFDRIYHFLGGNQWKEVRVKFIDFAQESIKTWIEEYEGISQNEIFHKIRCDIEPYSELAEIMDKAEEEWRYIRGIV